MKTKKWMVWLLAAALALVLPAGPGSAEEPETAAPETRTAAEPAAEASAETRAPEEQNSAAADEETQTAAPDSQKLSAAYTLAMNAIEAQDYTTAKEYLEICFAYCDPANNPAVYADLLLKRACIYEIEGKYELALLNLDAAVQIRPDLSDAYLVKAQVYAETGDGNQAASSLEKYIEVTQDTAMYETVAALYETMGNMEAAQSAYVRYAESVGAGAEEAAFYFGFHLMEAGKYTEATGTFEVLADNETFGAAAMYNIGICRMKLEDYPAAAQAFTECEEKGGCFEGQYYNRGLCSMMIGDWVRAAEDFTVSVRTESYQKDARYYLGICSMQAEDYEAAAAAFTELIGDGDQAEQMEAGTESGEAEVNYDAYYYRGLCRGAMGDLAGAEADYTVCIENGHALSQSYYQRAKVYEAMGDREKQASDLSMSLRFPD